MSISNSFSSTDNRSETSQPLLNLEFQKHSVEFTFSLPKEIEEVTRNTEVYDGVLNWNTEHAAVVTQTHCFVWNYGGVDNVKQPFERDTPVYKFKMPICEDDELLDDLSNHHKLPLVCIIPSNQHKKPGLLVCSRKGEFRYWEDITRDSIFEDHYSSLKVYLQEGDFGTHLACHETHQSSQDTCIIIFGSAQSVLYRINISKIGINFSSLSRSVGIMENFSSYLWLSSKYDTGDIITTTLGNKLENNLLSEVFVLMDKSIEKWAFGHVRSVNKYVQGQDIYNNIIQEIYLNDSRIKKTDQVDLRLLDMEFARNSELVILVSYFFGSNQNEIVENKNLSYALVILNTEEIQFSDAVIYKVNGIHGLKNQSNLLLGPQANLVMPNGGPGVYVIFPQAIIITTLLEGSNYSNIVSLHDPVGDRIIGFCGEGSKSWHDGNIDRFSQINILTAKTGIMTCKLNLMEIMDEISHTQNFDDQMNLENSQEMRDRELKRMLEQAVFNTSEKVPVTNYISREHGGDVNSAAIEISDEIMNSRSQYLFDHIELKSQLNERCNKMTLLIQIIKFSNMLNELYPPTRQHLFWNAEKMACALKLWEYYNASLSSRDQIEDTRRKLLVRDIGYIFIYIERVINDCLVQEDSNILIPEANNIILLSFEAAFNFRRTNKDLYAITSNCLKESWTFHPELLKVLYQQFEKTADIIQNSDIQNDGEKIESLKDHLVKLADILLGVTSERLKCDDSITREDAQVYRKEWTTILRKLVHFGKNDDAFGLSETYAEYKILVDLVMYYGQNTNYYIKKYVNKYQENFEYPLYEWYIEKELYADLLSQPHAYEYKDSLQKFLNERKLSGISWMHDIYLNRYGDASVKLRHLARNQPRVDRNKTFLSMSKLTFLAELGDEIELKNEDIQRNLEEIENGFELLNAYSDLQQQFVSFIMSQSSYHDTESEQVNAIMEGTAGSWKNYKPALAQIYEKQVIKILHGEIIPTSELVEVMTLKDKKMTDDFPFALQFTLNDNKLPEDHRRTILQTIWRRIYFSDNWEILLDTSNMSDEELNEHTKNTFVYNALNIVRHSVDIPLNQWFYPPADAFFSSTIEQFHKWYPSLSEEQIKSLIEDYLKENDTLKQCIENYHLNKYVEYALGLLNLKSKFE
ncbi:Non-repetitive/WGA-negative nucleoporin C-terminal-domain-containing protein [Glomus cerebriforme]|uniref:Non-repetitive/WGA-negative nucleoporin C-terminal-domain-containing protein n=1 Tax=Glomus cerebriforme TaxID=658196 RepID=A0A397T1X3_9GLOM|nr:Non-repetitive/WGA-negative nucleoporin C-terminal-domain-containing protein [Glomus cerebriforme]